jgi:hypothetical protein
VAEGIFKKIRRSDLTGNANLGFPFEPIGAEGIGVESNESLGDWLIVAALQIWK